MKHKKAFAKFCKKNGWPKPPRRGTYVLAICNGKPKWDKTVACL